MSRVDPSTRVVVQTIAVGSTPGGLAVGGGAVWVANNYAGTVSRIDPTVNRVVQTIAVGNAPSGAAVGDGSVWVTNDSDRALSRIDAVSGAVIKTIALGSVTAVIAVGEGPSAIAVAPRSVWVASQFAGTVSEINPTTDVVRRTVTVGNRPDGLAWADGTVWVGSQAQASSHRGGTLSVLSQNFFGTADPALTFGGYLLTYTNDGLTAYPRFGGPQSARVAPDLAAPLPIPTDGGTTYTFQLRHGLRYSDGQPVRPEDFRRALERDLELSPNLNYGGIPFANVIGGAACAAHPRRCDLSRGVVANDAADTVTFHLVAPDPEILQRLALPDAVAVPAGTPFRDIGNHPIPETGPYAFADYSQHEVKLVRNPYFHVWSRAARPHGFPDQIVFRFGASPSAELTAVEQNGADYTLDGPPADRLTEAQTRFASRLHVNPNDLTDMVVLNTRGAHLTICGFAKRSTTRSTAARSRA